MTSNVATSKKWGLLVKRTLISGIKTYQGLSATTLIRNCRFYPSCSQYAIDAIEHYGVVKGIIKSTGRILRCSPLSDGGHDPVRPNF